MEASTPDEFFGLSVDYWQAIATFSAPIVAGLLLALFGVKLAGRRLRQELQGQDARRQFLERGLVKLGNAYEEMIGAIRLNYAVCSHLLKLLRDIDSGDPAAPRPDDLPALVPAIADSTAFAAIGPSSRIVDFPRLGELATEAFSRLLNVNLWFLTEIWLPVRGYYSREGVSASLDRAENAKKLMALAQAKYYEAEIFNPLPRLLGDLALRTMELGLNSFDDFWCVRKDKEIGRLRGELDTLLAQVKSSDTS